MGRPVCRDILWLQVSVNFSVDMFTTAFMLQIFPSWMHFIVIYLLPWHWRLQRQVAIAKRFIATLMQQHANALESGESEEDTLLNWQIDHATPSEKTISEMAKRQCVLTLASIHTTSMAVSNMLYDLCEHPQWFSTLVEEIEEITEDLGEEIGSERPNVSGRQWCDRLQKLDSCFVESQRLHPPILCEISLLTWVQTQKTLGKTNDPINSGASEIRPRRFDPKGRNTYSGRCHCCVCTA